MEYAYPLLVVGVFAMVTKVDWISVRQCPCQPLGCGGAEKQACSRQGRARAAGWPVCDWRRRARGLGRRSERRRPTRASSSSSFEGPSRSFCQTLFVTSLLVHPVGRPRPRAVSLGWILSCLRRHSTLPASPSAMAEYSYVHVGRARRCVGHR